MAKAWFEISHDGWRRLNAGRPLGALMCEAVQNAFDEDVRRVDVRIEPHRMTVEDDGKAGFADERLVYTIFLTGKADSPTARGRQGRGLKELLAAVDAAEVETVGFTVRFDAAGRHVEKNARRAGTVVRLERQSTPEEVAEAVAALRLIIPEPGVLVTVNGERLKRPVEFATLTSCRLETVVSRGDVERIVERETAVTLLVPRSPDEPATLFEMGLPICMAPTPWHIDVGQRIVRDDQARSVESHYRTQLLVLLFESMVGGALPDEHLRDGWVLEILTQDRISEGALRTWVRRTFPERAVLAATAEDDDRARQRGAVVIDATGMSPALAATLGRVLQSSADFVDRSQERAEEITAVPPGEERALGLYAHLAKRLLGRSLKLRLMRRKPDASGFVEDAIFDARRNEIRINVLGCIDLTRPLSGESLGILLHEIAHADSSEHGPAFVDALSHVAGRASELLLWEGRELAERYGIPMPSERGSDGADS